MNTKHWFIFPLEIGGIVARKIDHVFLGLENQQQVIKKSIKTQYHHFRKSTTTHIIIELIVL
jgi:hypothetical protein